MEVAEEPEPEELQAVLVPGASLAQEKCGELLENSGVLKTSGHWK